MVVGVGELLQIEFFLHYQYYLQTGEGFLSGYQFSIRNATAICPLNPTSLSLQTSLPLQHLSPFFNSLFLYNPSFPPVVGRGLFLALRYSLCAQYNMASGMQGSLQQFCSLQLSSLLELAYEVSIRVVGAVKEIFQHKRYIVEVYVGKKLVLRCLKRYSEFEALYEVVRMNFKNIDLNLDQFPSKFQVINREETRREYFELLLNRAVQVYTEKVTNQTNRRLLSTIYVFMAGEQAKNSKTGLLSEGSSCNEENARKPSINSEEGEEGQVVEKEGKVKVHRMAEVLPNNYTNKSLDKPIQTEQIHLRAFMSTEFLIRFSDQEEWKERFLKLEGSCLLIYKHKNDNNFKTKIELYQSNIHYLHRDKNILDHFCEKMEFDHEATYLQDFTTLAIHHQYDYKKLLLKVKEDQRLPIGIAKELLIKASHQTTNCQQIEGVFSPIGKVFLILHKLYLDSSGKKLSPIVHLRINAGGLLYQSKLMNVTSSAAINIKQGFLIPISNAFANIFVEVIVNQNDGIISHGTDEKCVGRYRLCFSDFLSYPSGYGLEKIHGKPEVALGEVQKYDSLVELSVINYSHFSSNYADSYANQNDGIIMQGLKSTQDTELLVITVDRVLRVIGNIALFITAFWRNVYLFKYPRMGYAFFTLLPILILFGNAGTVFQLLLGSLLMGMAYNLPRIHFLINLLLEQYIFSCRHPCHKQPLCLDSNELKFMKWTQNLSKMSQDYRLTMQGKLQKSQQAKAKKVEYWQFEVHGKRFKIREELPSLLEKVFEVKKIIELVLRMISAVINTVEKVCNVLSWADPRRSLFVFLTLVLIACVASTYLIRAIAIIFCLHRLWKGENFYRLKHYHSNRRLAIYSLRYIVNKAFPHLLPNRARRIETIQQAEIVTTLGEVLFPVRDESAVKKLKEELQFILGVFVDAQELLRREERKNEMRLFYLIEIIESCEARLKLEWISGAEGINQDFQQLKALTREEVVIDLWVESLLINFFWNTPSQLYTTFRPVRSPASLRCQKAKDTIADCFIKLAS